MREVLFFPIKNEQGFRVNSIEAYNHMIATIIAHSLDMQEQFPDNPVLVVYEVNDGS